MTRLDEALIFLAQTLVVGLGAVSVLYILEKMVEAVQSRILIFKLKRTPYVRTNSEK